MCWIRALWMQFCFTLLKCLSGVCLTLLMQCSVRPRLPACFLFQCFYLELHQPLPTSVFEVHYLPWFFCHNSPKRLLLAARGMIMKICYCRAGKPWGPVSQAWCCAGWSAALGPQLCHVFWQDMCVCAHVLFYHGDSFSWSHTFLPFSELYTREPKSKLRRIPCVRASIGIFGWSCFRKPSQLIGFICSDIISDS